MPRVSGGEVGREGAAERVTTASIAAEMERLRGRTRALVGPLSEEALRRQVREFMSPLLWDLGHIADFERLWLIDSLRGRTMGRLRPVFDPQETPRSSRDGDALPGKGSALRQLDRVRADVLRRLERTDLDSDTALLRDGFVYHMVLQHEAQHQETMLQSLAVPAADWGYTPAPLQPRHRARHRLEAEVQRRRHGAAAAERERAVDDEERVAVGAGPFTMGSNDRSRAYDNERLAHEVTLAAFDIDRFPVTNRRWQLFMRDGGYRRDELWSSEGSAWRRGQSVDSPLGWMPRDDGWKVRRFGSDVELDPSEPVQHVSYWEAEAFAAWAGGRLPSEAEWEKAVAGSPQTTTSRRYPWGDRLQRDELALVALDSCPETAAWGPPRVGRLPHLASAYGVEDALGAVYQWTCSRFRPYPGFEAFPYAGYSEVFFGDSYRVLRGASWAADDVLWRCTYRNWDFPRRRQIFAGLRVVYDA